MAYYNSNTIRAFKICTIALSVYTPAVYRHRSLFKDHSCSTSVLHRQLDFLLLFNSCNENNRSVNTSRKYIST